MKGAWVTLATNDSYSLGALVLAHSLKQVGTTKDLAILVTPGVTNSMKTRLSQVFNFVQEVNVLDSRDKANLRLLQRPELGITFTKLHCWQLTQYEKCVFLDADTLVLQNCDELFEREELSAAPDVGWPDCFNSGVFVYRPSGETYDKLIQFALEKGSFDGGDQGLLNLYFSDWAHKDISKHLPFIYNVCSTAFYSYLPAFKQYGKDVKILHFIGNAKPWLQYFDTETRRVRPTGELGHIAAILQKWWDIFCSMIQPNLSADMSGLAGAFAKLTLGQRRSPEQEALENTLRRQNWEQGNIDYLGKDSFDNIWSKICETLAKGPQQEPTAEEPQKSSEPQAAVQPEPAQKQDPSQTTTTGPDISKDPESQKSCPTETKEPVVTQEPTATPSEPVACDLPKPDSIKTVVSAGTPSATPSTPVEIPPVSPENIVAPTTAVDAPVTSTISSTAPPLPTETPTATPLPQSTDTVTPTTPVPAPEPAVVPEVSPVEPTKTEQVASAPVDSASPQQTPKPSDKPESIPSSQEPPVTTLALAPSDAVSPPVTAPLDATVPLESQKESPALESAPLTETTPQVPKQESTAPASPSPSGPTPVAPQQTVDPLPQTQPTTVPSEIPPPVQPATPAEVPPSSAAPAPAPQAQTAAPEVPVVPAAAPEVPVVPAAAPEVPVVPAAAAEVPVVPAAAAVEPPQVPTPQASGDACPVVPPPRNKSGGNKKQGKSKK